MSTHRRCAAAITALCGLAAISNAQIGPDVIVGDLPSTAHYGPVGDMHAYSVATTSCNLGDETLRWTPNDTIHPVIGQNLFRLHDGRFEQIGMSWLKHGFCALQQSICGPCTPAGVGCPTVLGVGCSDPYSASLNGQQSGLGPRFEVNPSTGEFQYPFTSPNFSGTLPRRIQVAEAELDIDGALYFVEGQYIHPEDAMSGNGLNNASYRRVTVNSSFGLNVQDTTQREIPAIFAWRDHGLGANMADPDVEITAIDIPGDGRVFLAAKATPNGDGTWRYEYAIQNLNSDRCISGLHIPRNPAITLTGSGFRDVDYHSGEPFDNTDWTITQSATEIGFTSPETFAQNPDTNALRWGTLYNFWFDANTPPVDRTATLDLFKPGTPSDITVTVPAPDVDGPLPVIITAVTPRPEVMTSGDVADFIVDVAPGDDVLIADSVFLNYRNGTPEYTETLLSDMGDGTYMVSLPAASCGEMPEFYISAEGQDSGEVTFPLNGAVSPFAIEIEGIGTPVVTLDTLESPDGWIVGIPSDSATTGIWEHGVPIATEAQPGEDVSEVGTNCWFTGNGVPGGGLGAADIDGGTTTLISRTFDLTDANDTVMSYWRWFSNNTGASPGEDVMNVEITSDGVTWFNVETVGPGADAGGGWIQHTFDPSAIVPLTSTVQLRFRVGDLGGGSIVEAAIDDIALTSDPCIDPSGCLCETDGTAGVDVLDLLSFLDLWFESDLGADVDSSTEVDVLDLLTFLECWFPAAGGADC